MDDIERDATVVKELYDLIETYKVPTPPEDLAVYQVWALQSTSRRYFTKLTQRNLQTEQERNLSIYVLEPFTLMDGIVHLWKEAESKHRSLRELT